MESLAVPEFVALKTQRATNRVHGGDDAAVGYEFAGGFQVRG